MSATVLERLFVGLLCVVAVMFVWALVMMCLDDPMARDNDCVKSHVDHRAAYLLPILVGKIIVPVWMGAEDVTVCDQWTPKR